MSVICDAVILWDTPEYSSLESLNSVKQLSVPNYLRSTVVIVPTPVNLRRPYIVAPPAETTRHWDEMVKQGLMLYLNDHSHSGYLSILWRITIRVDKRDRDGVQSG